MTHQILCVPCSASTTPGLIVTHTDRDAAHLRVTRHLPCQISDRGHYTQNQNNHVGLRFSPQYNKHGLADGRVPISGYFEETSRIPLAGTPNRFPTGLAGTGALWPRA